MVLKSVRNLFNIREYATHAPTFNKQKPSFGFTLRSVNQMPPVNWYDVPQNPEPSGPSASSIAKHIIQVFGKKSDPPAILPQGMSNVSINAFSPAIACSGSATVLLEAGTCFYDLSMGKARTTSTHGSAYS